MLLPTSTAEETVRFQNLHKNLYGTELTGSEALTMLTRLVQFYYLTGGHDAYCQRAEENTRTHLI